MVRRWHTNPSLSHTIDPLGYHGWRMAVLAIMLWPGAMGLIEACITPDLGEVASGDVPWGGDKTTADAVADQWSRDNGLDLHLELTGVNVARLKFLDRADAYLWARHNAPKLMMRGDWEAQREWLYEQANRLGVLAKWHKIMLDTAAA